jgi:predicted transcriptional regulator
MSNEKDPSILFADVEVLKRDINSINVTLNKLDTAIDKIADATGGISKILAVHDNEISERKRIAEKETELLHQRISDMKDESATHHRENHSAVMQKLDDMGQDVKSELQEVKERVTILERWKWWVMGGSWAIGFIIATILQVGGIVELLK